MDHSENTYETEIGVKKFIEFLQLGKLEIKVYPSFKIHAKVYISKFSEGDRDYKKVRGEGELMTRRNEKHVDYLSQ